MKKILLFVFVFIFVISLFALTGCKDKNEDFGEICQVTFIDWDGSIIQVSQFVKGGKPHMPNNPKKDDEGTVSFVFLGWDDESTEDVETLSEIVDVSENKTLRAVYKSTRVFRVNFVVDGEVYLSYKSGEIFNAPVPEKEGFEFAGWYKEETFETKTEIHFSYYRYLVEDEYLYAKFTPIAND